MDPNFLTLIPFDGMNSTDAVRPNYPTALRDVVQNNKPTYEWTLEDVAHITFSNLDEADHFYNAYASLSGFSLRKDRVYVSGDIITLRRYVCSKAGFRSEKFTKLDACRSREPRNMTRCGCEAAFKVRLLPDDGLYHTVLFEATHNHDVVPPNYSHFLPSHRRIGDATSHQIAELRDAGVKPSKIMDILVNSAGGFEWVGFLRRDLINHVYQVFTSSTIDTHDCDRALAYIQCLAGKDPGIYCKVYIDSEDRLLRLFFADTTSRSEYRAFGDVVVCDSTYKTNRPHLPLVMLEGVDNHRCTIVFACAIVTDETHETYKWVFSNFINCMEGVHPGAILTDGDKAMRSAIREIMPHTRHRLCTWHLLRNHTTISHHPDFSGDLKNLVHKRYPIDMLEKKWDDFTLKYGLNEGSRWATDMRETIHMWAVSYFDGVFLAGMRSTQRAESANNMLKEYVDDQMTMEIFFHKYMIFLDRMRHNSMRNDCLNSQSRPAILTKAFRSMRMEVATLYTMAAYKKVDAQIDKAQMFTPVELTPSLEEQHTVYRMDKYDPDNNRVSDVFVTCDPETNHLTCTCGLTQNEGVPCRHMFAVIRDRNILKFPISILNPRWMKNARSMCTVSSHYSQRVTGYAHQLSTIRPQCDRLAYLSSLGEEHIACAQNDIAIIIDRLSSLPVPDDEGHATNNVMLECFGRLPIIRDPPVIRTKGAPRQGGTKPASMYSICHERGHKKPTCPLNPKNAARVISGGPSTHV